MRIDYRRFWCLAVVWIFIGTLFLVPGPVGAHSGATIDAEWASVVPSIDGAMSPGEWADAARVNLGVIPGNSLQAFLLVMNDDTFLWLAYDATGDVTNVTDAASFALDTGHDGTATQGAEDQFFLYDSSQHLVYDAGGWTVEDAPFNPSLPDHAGLAGAPGFGPSDLNAAPHRIFEFQIPLALIGAAAGDTLGLFGGSQPAPGVVDVSAGTYSTWPDFVTGPIPQGQYGDLNLAVPPGPVGVSISPSSAFQLGAPGSTVEYTLTVRNRGTAGADTFDLTSLSTWTVGLWDAAGASRLSDTDGDTVPDTGTLSSGASLNIVVRVDLPPTASGCDAATIIATSSADTAVWDTSTLTTCTGPASFAPPHADFGIDTDGDLLYNYLEVDVMVDVATTGYYDVVGELYSGDGSVYIDDTFTSFYSGPGTVLAPLTFDGGRIVSSGLDGPYRVELNLFNEFRQLIDTDVHTTRLYTLASFDPPAARFTPPHADLGIDDDVPPNGMYDRLVLRASLQVSDPGNYYISTSVFDTQGSYVTSGSAFSWLDTGNRIVEIDHRGLDFYRAVGDGPYRIEMLVEDYFGLRDDDTHIAAYTRADFDPPPISFAPPHSDIGEDTDLPPDGLYDFLVVSASVTIAEGGDFKVSGELYGPGGGPPLGYDEVTVSLSPGPAAVDLRFSGPAIRRAGVSGNFEVTMYAQEEGDFNLTDYDQHRTGYYDFTEFQPPPARFSPPHTDRAIDVSLPPDGYDDFLVIDASVDVTRAGRFVIDAYVQDSFGRFVARALGAADLDIGRGSIPLRIDGHRIWEIFPTMPLLAYLELYDENDNALDFAVHQTSYYDPQRFQPPDSDVPSSAASVSGGYLRSVAPLSVDFIAADPSPSDGIAAVALYYRFSPNNLTWFPWTQYAAQAGSIGLSEMTGTFLFDLPDGDGYYEFSTVAADFGGNEEAWVTAPDARVAVFVPVRVELATGSASMSAGATVDVTVRAVSAAGEHVILEDPLQVSLLTSSAAGSFRDVAGNPVTQVVIPAGASEAPLRYEDTRAGIATLSAFASGLEFGSAALAINPGAAFALTLSPSSAGVPVASSVTFTAAVWDAYGNAIGTAALAWSVQGNVGTITSGGVFTAGTIVGSGVISVESSGLVATATIVSAPGPLDRVEAFATSYALAPGDSATIRMIALDAYGNAIPDAAFGWSVQGPGTFSGTTGDEVTVLATGAGTIRVTAAAGSIERTIDIVAQTHDGLAPIVPVGVGGVIGGLVVGFAVGWFLSRRRKAPAEQAIPPKAEEPGIPK